ncbi:MAG: ISAs1 family transposase [Acetobacteraceae bacterium]|nr:ISAs1 family transposase [Acetobacteraceae bacterium]
MPKKHFEVAATAGIALIVQVKDNQPTLRQRVQEVSATTAPLGSAHSRDTGRNRDERRTVAVFDPTDRLANTDWRGHIAAVIRVERDVSTRSAATGPLRHAAETAFYVSNTPLTAARAAEAIRAHWRVENTSHHSRDVTLGEGHSRIRTNPGVFARLRSFAFIILMVLSRAGASACCSTSTVRAAIQRRQALCCRGRALLRKTEPFHASQ